jgi:hypothetical protein
MESERREGLTSLLPLCGCGSDAVIAITHKDRTTYLCDSCRRETKLLSDTDDTV